jgi:hypothetical protein
MTELPHLLTLANDEDHDPDMPMSWTSATLTCPHQPPFPAMPCAVHGGRCGCPPGTDEQTDDWGGGRGPCPTSPTGEHVYFEGEPLAPQAECWAVHHAEGLEDAARNLSVGPGSHEVWPRHIDGCIELWLTHPEAAAVTR